MSSPVDTGESLYVAPQLTVRAVDEQTGDSLHEIYVLYRVAPPPEEPEEQGLLDYLRGLVVGEDEEPPPPPFELAVTDEDGYLMPVFSDEGLVECVESLKLTPEIDYEVYLVRHPDPRLARAAQDELNGVRAVSITRGWPAPHVFTPTLEALDACEEQLTVALPSRADAFLPPGPARYDGWALYQGMPHAGLPEVKQAVEKLQHDLGALRYVIGAYPPYEPEADNKKKNNPTANVGKFDARVMSAVLHFQREVLAGEGGCLNAFAVTSKADAHDKAAGATAVEASHAYLQGNEVSMPPPSPQAGERALRGDGVVDAITGRALEDWLGAGCRRLGPVLVGVTARVPTNGWTVWLRDDAHDALHAWRELTVAMGCSRAIAANHTYRTPLQDVGRAGYGRSAVSIHKTGLAIDVGVKNGFREAVDDWPVVFERDALVERTRRGTVIGHRAYWRLFARSDLPAEQAEAATTLRSRLDALAGQSGMVGRVAAALRSELDADADAFFDACFRTHAAQWIYDPFDDEGGSPGAPQTPSERYGDPAYTRWIDITALGERCSLRRIGSFTNKLSPTGSDWGLAGTRTRPNKVSKLTRLATMLVKAQAEVEDPITLSFEGKSVPLADLRASELAAYAEALPQFWRDRALKRFSSVAGAKLSLRLSWSESGREAVETAAGALEGLEIPLMATAVDTTPRTGAEWAQWLRARVDELEQEVPAQQSDGASASAPKPPQRLTLYPVIAEHTAEDGTVTPLRVRDTETITHPAPGSPIGMEWWHFQRSDLVSQVREFGKLLLELGWTEEGLLDTPSATTYGRIGVGYPRSELDKRVG